MSDLDLDFEEQQSGYMVGKAAAMAEWAAKKEGRLFAALCMAIRQRNLRKRRKSNGTCAYCNKHTESGRSICQAHREKIRDNRLARSHLGHGRYCNWHTCGAPAITTLLDRTAESVRRQAAGLDGRIGRLSPNQRTIDSLDRIEALRVAGMSLREIAAATGLSRCTVHKYAQRVSKQEAMARKHKQWKAEGRPVLPPWQRKRKEPT